MPRSPGCATIRNVYRPETGRQQARNGRIRSASLKFGQCNFGDVLCRNAEMLVEVLVGRAVPERGHADEHAVGADDGVPPLPDPGLDPDIDSRGADYLGAVLLRKR